MARFHPVFLVVALASAAACNDYQLALLDAHVQVQPRSLDFGAQALGGAAVDVVTLSNPGAMPLRIDGLEVEGEAFAVDGPVPDRVPAGGAVTVAVRYAPEGVDEGVLVIHTEAGDAEVALDGRGVAAMLVADPAWLDFGAVALGDTVVQPVRVTNVSLAPITVAEAGLFGEAFVAELEQRLPLDLEPGEGLDLVVAFHPVASGEVRDVLRLAGDFRLEVPVTGHAELPVAVCDVTPNVVDAFREPATWLGHGSHAGDGGPVARATWTLVQQPVGSAVTLAGDRLDVPGFVPDLAGIYVAELVVEDAFGARSEPCRATLEAWPASDLWVEMFWTEAGDDIDLHLVAPGGTRNTESDCYWRNCVGGGLDWGTVGEASDDPMLDLDDIKGVGPEIIDLPGPKAGVYTVAVHDFPRSELLGRNDVTVRIHVGAELVWEDTRPVYDEGSYVPFATVAWPSGVVTSQ